VKNDVSLAVSAREKLPSNFRPMLVKATSSSIEIKWRAPEFNGVIKKYVVVVVELDLELEIRFDFNSQLINSVNISALDFNRPSLIYFSSDLVFNQKHPVVNTASINDLKPASAYTVQVHCCNSFGCIKGDEARVMLLDADLKNFKEPIVFVLGKNSVEIVWQEPDQINGKLVKFIIYRNNLKINQITSDMLLTNAAGFYIFTDSVLHPDTFYSYHIEAFNENYSLKSRLVRVHTPKENFADKCFDNKSEKAVDKAKSILVLDTLRVNLSVTGWNEVSLVYSVQEWKEFLSCLLRSDMPAGNRSVSTLSMRILLHTKSGGLQVIEFPYPDDSITNNLVKYRLGSLLAYTSYAIRISLSSVNPFRQVYTSQPVYVKTLGEFIIFIYLDS